MKVEDQRHPGKPDAKIHSSTRQVDAGQIDAGALEKRPTRASSKRTFATSRLSSDHGSSTEGGGSRRGFPKESEFNEMRLSGEAAGAGLPESQYITGFPLLCLIIGLMLAVFLISIDRTIISTVRRVGREALCSWLTLFSQAIPYITAEFKSTPDIGWYGSSYLLTACAFQPVFGRIFMLFDVKKAYLIAMFLFELGSLICGVAPSSMALIVGRAIAGFGSAGILTGSFVVVATAVPLQMRPLFMAVVGVM